MQAGASETKIAEIRQRRVERALQRGRAAAIEFAEAMTSAIGE